MRAIPAGSRAFPRTVAQLTRIEHGALRPGQSSGASTADLCGLEAGSCSPPRRPADKAKSNGDPGAGRRRAKTTLRPAELALWASSQTRRFRRAVFVSFEQTLTADAALALIGQQLVTNYELKADRAATGDGWR